LNISKERLLVFHGCDHKVGTTMVSYCAAKLFAKYRSPGKVLFLALNDNDEIHYYSSKGTSIEEIKSRVDNRLMSGDEIMDYCEKDVELFVLGGLSGLINHRDYDIDFSEKIVTESLNTFDLVIADCGNNLDCSLAVGSLISGGLNILVVNQNESSLLRYEANKELYEILNISFDVCAVNRFLDSDPHDLNYLKARLGRECFYEFSTLKEERNFGRLAEIDGHTLMDYRTPGFSGDIKSLFQKISKLINSDANANPISKQGRSRRTNIM